ncbi:hypothetical protein FIV34_05720 [Luteibacter pinisoli]|uniref:CBM-cenC domain-containing protein n=1 Tax=Luteibacter pinisoli TaxID=2589080 RepID=A0A4Y5Z2S8_9GAMM|nr:hypothetical protein [Luteibacter pinisoli]QDE38733.1 hypothetical protein FIV34_05720 [Luteibacter pinisoli]
MNRTIAIAAAAAAAVLALPVSAVTAHGDEAPLCPVRGSQPVECRLAIENAGFDGEGSLVNWMPHPFRPKTVRIEDDGNAKLVLAPGGSVSQVVSLPASSEAVDGAPYFVPSMFVRATGGDAEVELSVQLVGRQGSYEAFSHVYAAGDAWSRPSGGFDASRGQATSMIIGITRKDSNAGATVYVDDVQVIRQR